MGHGDHWECLGGDVKDLIAQFIPSTLARGKVGKAVRREAKWFGSDTVRAEAVIPISHPETPLRSLALLVSDAVHKRNSLISAYPYSVVGGRRRLRIQEIRDWGNAVEGELVCATVPDGAMVGFFDTHYYATQDRYRVGETYDFRLAGLVFRGRCTNDEAVTISDQRTLDERYRALGTEAPRRSDGTIEPLSIQLAGCSGMAPTDARPDCAEFYCVIGKVSEFALEGIRVFRITPKRHRCPAPVPTAIFAVPEVFRDGYIPKVGDSIGGGLWVQGFLAEPKAPRP